MIEPVILFRMILLFNAAVVAVFAYYITEKRFFSGSRGFVYLFLMAAVFLLSFFFGVSSFFLWVLKVVVLAHSILFALILSTFVMGLVFALIGSRKLAVRVVLLCYLPSLLLFLGNVYLFKKEF